MRQAEIITNSARNWIGLSYRIEYYSGRLYQQHKNVAKVVDYISHYISLWRKSGIKLLGMGASQVLMKE
jgi:hypothetical protein